MVFYGNAKRAVHDSLAGLRVCNGTYQYTAQRALSMLNSVWQKAYNVIANVNNALKFIDKRQGVLDPASYRMIKGELLAIRAMLHFDMMRLYGYGNLAGRTDKSTKTNRAVRDGL